MSLRDVTLVLAAGASDDFGLLGNYFRAKTAPYPVIVENLQSGGRDVFSLSQGEDAQFGGQYQRLKITNTGGADATFVFTVGKDAKVNSALVSGSVAVTSLVPTASAGANSQKTVTNVAAVMVAANATRKYLLVQNNDPAGDIFLNFGGVATLANGVKVQAGGGVLELNCNILTAAISAIGNIASNANIVVVEG